MLKRLLCLILGHRWAILHVTREAVTGYGPCLRCGCAGAQERASDGQAAIDRLATETRRHGLTGTATDGRVRRTNNRSRAPIVRTATEGTRHQYHVSNQLHV